MARGVFQFGEFRLDCDQFELLRAGQSLRIERKPMELLILLATRQGDLVTRDEIAQRLWGGEVFVDTEHGINTAIRKIRYVLREDSEQPRFVQTVMGKGYRFLGAVEEVGPASVQASEALASEPQEGRANSRVWLAVAVAAILLAMALTIGARVVKGRSVNREAVAEIHSLAVLPLDNLSGDKGQDYFADGMTDELTTMLAKDSTLRIVSRTSVMQYKGVHRPLREIAGALGVDGIVEGSVERSGDKVHMTLQLIQGPSDTHVWAESYDRDANDLVSLPDDAAMEIAKRTHSTAANHAQLRYVSPEAHDAYLHGRYIWYAGSNEEAEKYFKKAVELQPDYAAAWTGVADYYAAGAVEGVLDPREAREPAEIAAQKAVELDDSLPQAHNTLCAVIIFFHWDPAAADRECIRAIELDPKFAESYHLRAKVLSMLNRHDEAIASQKNASELDPFSRPWALAYMYVVARQYDAALVEVRQHLEANPHDSTMLFFLTWIYRCKGMKAEAAKAWEDALIASGNKADAASIQSAFERGGYRAVLLWNIADLKKQSLKHYVSPVDLALQYAQLGDRAETLSELEEGYRQHSPMLLEDVQDDPAYDFLHSDERYRAIIKKTGMPPEY